MSPTNSAASKVQTLPVNPLVSLAYTDSGAPHASGVPYTTIFAIHGLCFNSHIFSRLQSTAKSSGYRLVCISRRSYGQSTPFTPGEIELLTGVDTDEERKTAFVEARAHEVAIFIDEFTRKFALPKFSEVVKDVDEMGGCGGNILLGWSLGTHLAAATIAYAPTLLPEVRARFAANLRAVIFYDTTSMIMGLPEGYLDNWAPTLDTSIPESVRLPAFAQWVTSYFNNGDYSNPKRDPTTLAYVLPSTDKTPTIYTMTPEERAHSISFGEGPTFDGALLFFFAAQLKRTCQHALANEDVRALFPGLKKTFIAGDRSPAFVVNGLWAVQDELKALGAEEDVACVFSTGSNHFLHVDHPEEMLKLIASAS